MSDSGGHITTAEAARQLYYSRNWVTVLLNRGELQGRQIEDGRWLVSIESVERLKQQRWHRQAKPDARHPYRCAIYGRAVWKCRHCSRANYGQSRVICRFCGGHRKKQPSRDID